jgi:hypothetical protein
MDATDIDASIFLAIGKEMCINKLNNKNIHILEEFHEEKYRLKYIEKIEDEIFTHTTNLANIKNNIIDLEEKQKLYKYNNYFFSLNRNIENQKYYYNNITLNTLKEEELLLEDKITKLKKIYKLTCNK